MKKVKKQLVKNFFGVLTAMLILGQLVSACADTPTPTAKPEAIITNNPQPTNRPLLTPTAPTATNTAGPPIATATQAASPTATPTIPLVAPELKAVTASTTQPGRYNKFELTVELKAAYNNPFDPAQVDLHATFTAPNGANKTVPGFYWQDFSSQPAGKKEILTPQGQAVWKIRFAPTEVGQWNYFVEVVTPGGTARSNPTKIEVTASDNPGYLQVSKQDAAYLEFSTGKPYFAIGQNVGWYGEGGTQDYSKWFGQMAANGSNFARLWMASWALGIEWSDGKLGDYSNRLDRAWQLDQIFNLAEQQNIYIMLSLLNHGAFSKTTNTEWAKNPYNAALGGPCAEPQDFATNPQARELFKQRLRYIAARWGYSTNLLAWEWWNEVDYTPISNRTLLKPWIEEMTAALRSWESYPHLKTNSYSRAFDEVIYGMPELDLVQRHEYSPQDSISTFPRNMATMRALGKPTLYGEYGISGDSGDGGLDKWGIHLHNGLWAGLMTKGFGTSMNWWWDNYVDPLNLYPIFGGLAAFVQAENLAATRYEPLRLPTDSDQYAALILKSDKRILGWVKSDSYSYSSLKTQYETFLKAGKLKNSEFMPEYPAIAKATLSLSKLTPGTYRLEWWSTDGKGILQTSQLVVPDATFNLPVPEFKQDIAFKLSLL